jgi:hypothetical protein
VWWSAAVAVLALALAGTVTHVPVQAVVAIGSLLLLVGGALGLSLREELPGIRHIVLCGAAALTLPALYPGLDRLLGDVAIVPVVALVLVNPRFVAWLICRRRSAPPAPSGVAATTSLDTLRREWEESGRQLARSASVSERLALAEVRQQILDDLDAQGSGSLPDFVWGPTSDRRGRDRFPGDR